MVTGSGCNLTSSYSRLINASQTDVDTTLSRGASIVVVFGGISLENRKASRTTIMTDSAAFTMGDLITRS